MALAQGPFDLRWGNDVLAGVSSIDFTYDVTTNDVETVQGVTYTTNGSHKVSIELELAETDIPALKTVLPQHWVANGQQLSTGQTVNTVDGAIDIVPAGGCETAEESTTHDLRIFSCGSSPQVMLVNNASTEIAGVDFGDGLRKITVRFTGNAPIGEATVQFYKNGTLTGVS